MTNITWTNDTRRLADLVPWEHNPKRMSKKQADGLRLSIERFGFAVPFLISPAGDIYDGHQRQTLMEAITEYGPNAVVDVRVSSRPLTDDERRELVVRLKQNQAGWDFDMLPNLYEREELIEWGFEPEELGMYPDDEPEGDDPGPQIDRAEELREKWGVNAGDLWQLGDHRLVCGDCTDAAVVARVMDGERARLLFTDPPYGIEHDTSWREQAGISSMGPQSAKGIEWDGNDDWSVVYASIGADVAFIWHASSHNIIVAQSLVAAGYDVRQMIIWNKTVAPFGRSHYSYKHEPCWYAVRKGCTSNWRGPSNEVTVWDAASPRHIMGGSTDEKSPHPTQKPIELCERPIRNHTDLGDIVADPFLGSGTTMIACERLNRRCRAVEISPAYVAVALERWATMTGREPVLVAGPSTNDTTNTRMLEAERT